MDRRLELHAKFKEILGSDNVYYQPPESLKLKYPCLVYSKYDIPTNKANNSTYISNTRYDITHISRQPDSPVIDELLSLQYCCYDRHYISDNLHHDVLTIYY